jgi:hypothetical protein
MSKTPQEIGRAVLEGFARGNEQRRSQGAALREQIRRIVTERPEFSARDVLKRLDALALGRELPALRTVQAHLTELKKNSRHAFGVARHDASACANASEQRHTARVFVR